MACGACRLGKSQLGIYSLDFGHEGYPGNKVCFQETQHGVRQSTYIAMEHAGDPGPEFEYDLHHPERFLQDNSAWGKLGAPIADARHPLQFCLVMSGSDAIN